MKKINSKNNFWKSLSVGALALMLMVSPMMAKADDNKKNNDHREIKMEAKANKDGSCLRAFGHLVAPGWLKLNGSAQVSGHCWFPFGISKKFKDDKPADTVAPVISLINSEANSNNAVITFNTDEKANATVFYGTTAGLSIDNSATLRVVNNDFRKDHTVRIPNLVASTKYYFVIKSQDKSGNTSTSAELNFTTKTPEVANDTTAPVIRGVVAASTNSSVTVGWITNEPASSKILYGTVSPLDVSASSTASVGSNDLVVNHLVTVPNLTANTQYYLVLQSKDAAGNVQSSTEFSAKTGI